MIPVIPSQANALPQGPPGYDAGFFGVPTTGRPMNLPDSGMASLVGASQTSMPNAGLQAFVGIGKCACRSFSSCGCSAYNNTYWCCPVEKKKRCCAGHRLIRFASARIYNCRHFLDSRWSCLSLSACYHSAGVPKWYTCPE